MKQIVLGDGVEGTPYIEDQHPELDVTPRAVLRLVRRLQEKVRALEAAAPKIRDLEKRIKWLEGNAFIKPDPPPTIK